MPGSRSEALTKDDGSEMTDLNFSFISVSQHLDDETRMDRLSMFSDTIRSVEKQRCDSVGTVSRAPKLTLWNRIY